MDGSTCDPSVPVRASGEPKWVSAARKLVASTRLIKTGDGAHLLEMALAEYDQSAAVSPSDDAARQPQDERLNELRMGHVRLDECSDAAETAGLPLYDRISAKIEKLSRAKEEVEHMLKASGAEMDILRARALAAEHRQAAAEYRAQRIVLDGELKQRAETAEAEVERLRAAASDDGAAR